MMFVDGMMVSQFNAALAGQFAGGMMIFILQSLALGVLNIINTFVSQNFGSDNQSTCARFVWNGFYLALIYSFILLMMQFFVGFAFSLTNLAPDVQAQATLYARYCILNTVFFLTARVIENFFFGLGKTRVVLVTSLIANVVNIGVNYVLIFGKLGFPQMELEGAAIGTVCSSVLLMVLQGSIFLSSKYNKEYNTRDFGCIARKYWGQIIKVGLPAGIHFFSDMFTWFAFTTILVGNFGTFAITANTVVVRYISLSFMPAVGIGIAATALVGKYIGMKRKDIARKRARAASIVSLVYMGICGLIFLLFGEDLMRFYLETMSQFEAGAASSVESLKPDQIAQVVKIGSGLFLFAAIFQLSDALCISYNGALRGAGDTLWPMIVTGLISWVAMIGLGSLIVWLFPELGAKGPWIAATIYIVIIGVLLCWRFESGAWEKIDLLKQPAEPVNLDTELEN